MNSVNVKYRVIRKFLSCVTLVIWMCVWRVSSLTGSRSSGCSRGWPAAPRGSGSTAPARERLRPGRACGERWSRAAGRHPAGRGLCTCSVLLWCRKQKLPARPGSAAPLFRREKTTKQTQTIRIQVRIFPFKSLFCLPVEKSHAGRWFICLDAVLDDSSSLLLTVCRNFQ